MRKSSYFLVFVLMGIFFTSCKEDQSTVNIYLVRHAEKDLSDTTANPPLTAEGLTRAEKLMDALDDVKLDGVYSTSYERNLKTVKPICDRDEQTAEIYVANVWEDMLNGLKANQDGNYLICGHGDNLLPMMAYLGVHQEIAPLGPYEYDNIFKVTLVDDSAFLEVRKY